MRRGGAILQAAFAGSLLLVASCGSKTPPAATPVASNSPVAGTSGIGLVLGAAAGASGTAQELPLAHPQTAYPDPSKLLQSGHADQSAESDPSSTPQQPAASRTGLMLEILERGPDQAWTIQIVNRSDQPAELVADLRLLWFEVTLPSKPEIAADSTAAKAKSRNRIPQKPSKPKKSLCKLPEPLAVGNQLDPRLVVHLEPGEGVTDQFDPRLYCFAEGDQRLLVPGAEIRPHFGWPEAPPKKHWVKGKRVEEPALQKPPFVARQSLVAGLDGNSAAAPVEKSAELGANSVRVMPRTADPRAAARLTSAGVSGADKQLEGATVTLKSEYAVWTRQGSSENPTDKVADNMPAIGLRLVQGSDAKAEHEATVELTLSNQSPLPAYVYFRREMVSYEVAGPAGVIQCPGRYDDRTPERSSFLHLVRNARRNFTTRLAELCPRHTFAIPGLYLVYARFTSTMDGRDQGIDAFVGTVYSQKPATVRIRTGEQRILQKHPFRPMQVMSAGNSKGSEAP